MGFVSGNHIFLFLIFLVIVLVIFGPGKLPDVGAGMGKAIREFRKASNDVKDSVVNATTDVHRPDESVSGVVSPAETKPATSGTKSGG